MQNFNVLSNLCICAAWFESYSVGNPEARFSRIKAQVKGNVFLIVVPRAKGQVSLYHGLLSVFRLFFNFSYFRHFQNLKSDYAETF